MQEITLRAPAKYGALANEFVKSYQLMNLITTGESNKKELLPAKKRICRFCGLDFLNTTFRTYAHLIPHFLGNNNIFSDFECDRCNLRFSRYENQLANMLGAERSLNKVKGKVGVPKFKSPSGLKITNEQFYRKDSINISRDSVNNSTFSFAEETSVMKITFPKNSYIPIDAYKCLMKIALSILPSNETEPYDRLKKYLVNDGNGNLKGCAVVRYHFSFGLGLPPHLFLFKKINDTEEAFTHWMYLACLNNIFWIPIMLNEKDLNFYNKQISYNIPPPLFAMQGEINNITISRTIEDWSSCELKKGEQQEISFNMKKADLQKIATFNPTTGEIGEEVKFNVDKIVSLMLVIDDGKPIELKANSG